MKFCVYVVRFSADLLQFGTCDVGYCERREDS